MVREAKASDAKEIASIYNYYVLNSTITFEEIKVDDKIILERINTNLKYKWWVFEQDGIIFGYAYSKKWKSRSAYRYTVESSIYIIPEHQQKGIGTTLYIQLIEALKKEGFRSVLAGISLPNDKSISFHEKFGFKKVGQLESVGFKFKRWIDVGYWELKI
tara:strand:+ start:321 stop:800 length:480 start_codon:yes stop_codon:yes gene_type:complete